MTDTPAIPSRPEMADLEKLSPFELRVRLIALAGKEQQRTGAPLLNAGRGNPNFVTATPRDAFFQFGLFAVEAARDAGQWSPDLLAQPNQSGIAASLRTWLGAREGQKGIAFLGSVLDWAQQQGWDADAFVWELADNILGEHYVSPPAMTPFTAKIAAQYLGSVMGEGFPAPEDIDLFGTEGGSAAMCYIFGTLFANSLLSQGDTVAIMAPVFTPYLDIADLPEFALNKVLIEADVVGSDGRHTWQFSPEQIDKLRDPSIKLLVCINPTNPPSVRVSDDTVAQIKQIIAEDNPDLRDPSLDLYNPINQPPYGAEFLARFRAALPAFIGWESRRRKQHGIGAGLRARPAARDEHAVPFQTTERRRNLDRFALAEDQFLGVVIAHSQRDQGRVHLVRRPLIRQLANRERAMDRDAELFFVTGDFFEAFTVHYAHAGPLVR